MHFDDKFLCRNIKTLLATYSQCNSKKFYLSWKSLMTYNTKHVFYSAYMGDILNIIRIIRSLTGTCSKLLRKGSNQFLNIDSLDTCVQIVRNKWSFELKKLLYFLSIRKWQSHGNVFPLNEILYYLYYFCKSRFCFCLNVSLNINKESWLNRHDIVHFLLFLLILKGRNHVSTVYCW
jgi:hypothetical protein